MDKIKKYKPTAIARMFNLKLVTVAQRFVSPYAKQRWGVTSKKRRDGSYDRYVLESDLHFWSEDTSYVGRPSFRQK